VILASADGRAWGCGEATSDGARLKARRAVGGGSRPAPPRRGGVVARIDASSDAEVRREIEAARKAGIVLPSGNLAALASASATTK
jgi:hypothetical protein